MQVCSKTSVFCNPAVKLMFYCRLNNVESYLCVVSQKKQINAMKDKIKKGELLEELDIHT